MTPHFDHYNKDGKTFSIYTHKPVEMILRSNAPSFCGMTKASFNTALKKYPHLRAFEGEEETAYTDYELQTWVNAVNQAKTFKPKWKLGLERLKQLVFINRTTLIDKIEKLFETEWSHDRRLKYMYGDRQIIGYQQAVKDILSLIKAHRVETWDYVPSLNDVVRHCYGRGVVRKIVEDRVLVDTVVVDLNDDVEYWLLEYKLSDLKTRDISLIWNSTQTPEVDGSPFIWDYRGIPYIRIV